MKTSMKKKNLRIKNNKIIIKEGWGDVAANMATDGSWTKIAKVALQGAFQLVKGVWNTGMKLPAKLIYAAWKGKSIKDVMDDWERSDKKIKEAQQRIIDSTGVQDTVDAFVGMCNPAAFALDKWNSYHDDEMKRKFNQTSRTVWNNTMGKISPELMLDDEESSDIIRAKIVYSNFVLAFAKKGQKISITSQDYIDSYDDFKKKIKRSFSAYIAPTNGISKTSDQFKAFLRFLNDLSEDRSASNNVVYKDSSLYKYVKEIIGEKQYKDLNEKLFSQIIAKKTSTDTAANIIISNDLSSALISLTSFIKGAENLNKAFKQYMKTNNISAEEEQAEEPASAPAEEPASAPVEEPAEEPAGVAAGVQESYKTKKKLFIRNKLLVEQDEEKEQKKLKHEFIKKGGQFYLQHVSFLVQSKFLIVLKMSQLKSAYIYSLYKDLSDNIENKKYIVSENSNTTGIKTEFDSLKSLLKNVNGYIAKVEKIENLLPEKNNILYSIESDFIEKGLDESQIKDQLNNSINLQDKEIEKKLLEGFAKELGKTTEELLQSINDEDINNVYQLLSAAAFYKDMIDNPEIEQSIDTQTQDSISINEVVNKISSKMNEILNIEKFQDVFLLFEGEIKVSALIKLLENLDVEFNKNTEAINNFRAIFDTEKINPILRQKEKELEEILTISESSDEEKEPGDTETSEGGLSYVLGDSKHSKVAIVNLKSIEDEES